MSKNKTSSFIKLLAFALTVAILLPSIAKITHDLICCHHHISYEDDSLGVQIYNIDNDCDFHKLKFSKNYNFNSLVFKKLKPILVRRRDHIIVSFLISNTQSIPHLRGPPLA